MLNRRHLSHIALNISGMVLPMLVGLAVVPGLIHRLGQDRFGTLTLAWSLVGYFGLLDLGMGKAITQYLSQQDAAGMPSHDQAAMARVARRLMWMLGTGWAAALLAATPWITTALKVPVEIRTETPTAWMILAAAVPFLMWSTCCAGVLEARSRFVAVNSVRIPAGVASFCLPWLVALYTVDLRALMASLLLMRIATALIYAWVARGEFVGPKQETPADGLNTLLRFGGWLTVSNLVSPLLAYFDRFAIAALLSVAAVTHYTVPFDVLYRLPMIPLAMLGVLFPLLARSHTSTDIASSTSPALVKSATCLLVAIWLPGMFLLATVGPLLLSWWIGPNLAKSSTPVWLWIAVGIVVNGFAHIAHTLLQSASRTDLIAKVHLIELLPYSIALWWAVLHFGLVGAAVVWTLRVCVDTLLLYLCAICLFPIAKNSLLQALLWATMSGIALTIIGFLESSNQWFSLGLTTSPSIYLGLMLAGALAWCGYHLYTIFVQNET
ncbi:oligosaccharide flippase family protein [Variovorax sp. HJSM1_2]|uniref:oligosaccharide flippase family protein n=1 Tax=Variovorax sp. HJSM1_2 TaxID=3366263 RepID=UPI003BC10E2D